MQTRCPRAGAGRVRLGAALLAALLAGCEVGPDFLRPDPPEAESYTPSPLRQTASAAVAGGEAQRFDAELDISRQWWALFHSKPLNELVERALAANPDLKAAQAALRVAQENVRAGEGAFFPTVQGSFNASRNKTASSIAPVPAAGGLYYSLYTAEVTVSYSPDVWGLNRRTVESLAAQAEAQRFQLEAAYLTLTANVVGAAIQEASLRGQIAATEEIVKAERELVQLLHRQERLGHVAGLDVAAQEAALAQAEATLPPLRKQLALQRDLLTALAGGLPSAELAETFDLAGLQLPQALPVSVPAKLVLQRPDLRQAEANLHAASATIGVAIANRLPNIALTANAGQTALTLDKLFAPGSNFWTVAGGATQTLFDGGTLLHKERASREAFEEARAQYRSTLVRALQNVADTLHALETDAVALQAALAAEQAAKTSLDITRKQLQLGAVHYLSLLNAEQTYLNAVVNLAVARGNRFADTAALFQALGGGWWNRSDVVADL